MSPVPIRERTAIEPKTWPRRLHEFFGSLPVRNYANDFVLWDMTADDVWQRYEMLPAPRCQAISRVALRYILSSLASVKPRTKKGLIRYASVIDEMKSQNPPIVPLKEEWTALISFYARVHRRPGPADVDKCMEVWSEMESRFGISANRVTFNVLLDVSTKTHSWQTVDILLQEMLTRNISLDRYTWTTLIHAAGLRKDGAEVRNLARSMLDCGEILDIVVMNAVISALLRSGEANEAERLFRSMKNLKKDRQAANLAVMALPQNRSTHTFLTSRYQYRARLNRKHISAGGELTGKDISPGLIESDHSYPVPDVATYNMILNHRCTVDGDFASVSDLLEEMQLAGIRDTEAMFDSLFSGFYMHGPRDRAWNLARLEYVFETFLKATDVKITQNIAVKAIRAFSAIAQRRDIEYCFDSLDRAWQRQGGDPSRRSTNIQKAYRIAVSYFSERRSTRGPSTGRPQADHDKSDKSRRMEPAQATPVN